MERRDFVVNSRHVVFEPLSGGHFYLFIYFIIISHQTVTLNAWLFPPFLFCCIFFVLLFLPYRLRSNFYADHRDTDRRSHRTIIVSIFINFFPGLNDKK